MKSINYLKKIISIFPVLILFLLAGCNSEGYFGEPQQPIADEPAGYPGVSASDVLQLQLIPVLPVLKGTSDIQIPINTSMRVQVLATLTDNSTLDLTNYVIWEKSKDIITIAEGGKVIGDTTGDTSITADYLGKKTNSVDIGVVNKTLNTIEVTPNFISDEVGKKNALVATAYYADGTSQVVSDYVDWIVSNATANIAIDGNHQVEGLSVGTASLKASWGRVFSDDVTVEIVAATEDVPEPQPVSIQLISQRSEIPLGITTPLQVLASFADGTVEDVTDNANTLFSFSDATVITLSENRDYVVGTKVGVTEVSASFNELTSNSVTITVSDAVALSLAITPASKSIAKGLTQQYQALATFSDGSVLDVTSASSWFAEDATIATVNNLGLSTGLNVGATVITAHYDNVISNKVTLTVGDAIIQQLQITPSRQTVTVGGTVSFVANAIFSDASSADISTFVTWVVGSSSIATVSNTGMVTGVTEDETTLVARFNGFTSNTAEIEVIAATLSSIDILPGVLSVPNGVNEQYTAIGTYSNGTTVDITTLVSWNTSDSSVATIDLSGLLHPLSVGNTTITATLGGITSNTSAVTVTNALLEAIQITPAVETTHLGLSQQYQAIGTYSDNSTRDITAEVNWLSSDDTIAIVNLSGLASTVSLGTVEFTASLNGKTSNTATLTINDAKLVSIAISAPANSISLGTNQQYTAVGTYSDGLTNDLTSAVAWVSSDTNVGTIDSTGLASSASIGMTDISASLDGITSQVLSLEVTDALLVQLIITPQVGSINGSTSDIPLGLFLMYTAQGVYADNSTQDLTSVVNWNSSDVSVATIDMSGMVSSVSIGSTNITASLDGVTSNVEVLEVTPATLMSISVSPLLSATEKGLTQAYTAIGFYTDGTDNDITASVSWSSSDTSIVTIDMTGLATAVEKGSAEITASLGVVTSNFATLNVGDAGLTSIAITPDSAAIANGQTQQYTAVGTYTDGTVVDITTNVAWTTDLPAIATIDASGLATGGTTGIATISAALGGVTSNDAQLDVGKVLISVSLEYGVAGLDINITNGSYRSLKLVGHYSDGTREVINTPFNTNSVWTHTGSGFTHTGNGHYQAISNSGSIDVTATYEGFSDTMTNAITAVPVSNRDCGVSTLTLSDGTTVYCPLRTNSPEIADPSIYGSQSFDGLGGPNGMELITANYAQAEALCTSLGRKLPTQAQFQLLTREYSLDDVPSPIYGVYHLVGWPSDIFFYTDYNETGNFVRATLSGSVGLIANGNPLYGVICVN